jgi:hypothetical protein
MKWKTIITVAALPVLCSCSFATREDVDQIGSVRRSYTLGWKEGPRDAEYRPYRQQVIESADCEPIEPRRRSRRYPEGS